MEARRPTDELEMEMRRRTRRGRARVRRFPTARMVAGSKVLRTQGSDVGCRRVSRSLPLLPFYLLWQGTTEEEEARTRGFPPTAAVVPIGKREEGEGIKRRSAAWSVGTTVEMCTEVGRVDSGAGEQ